MIDIKADVGGERRSVETTQGVSGPSVAGPSSGMFGAASSALGAGVLQRKLQRRALQRRAQGPGGGDQVAPPSPSSGGQTLPGTVQSRMEQSFGASFGEVRVHQDGAAEALDAHAFTRGNDIHFGPGQYSPGTRGGDELIGHELAHVVQQRAGRVAPDQPSARSSSGDGGDFINSDPALEGEADAAGSAAARGEAATVQGHAPGASLGGAASSAAPIQGYFRIRNKDFEDRGVDASQATFLGQDEDKDKDSPTFGSFLDAQGKTRTSNKDAPDLRVSNAGDFAMEDADFDSRQAKVFFAAKEQIDHSNMALRATHSRFQLHPTGRQIDVPDRTDSKTSTLLQVTAENVWKPVGSEVRHGEKTEVAEHCNAMAAEVTGAQREENQALNTGPGGDTKKKKAIAAAAPQGNVYQYVDTKVAAFVASFLENDGNVDKAAADADLKLPLSDAKQMEAVLDKVAQSYGKVLHDAKGDKKLRTRLTALEKALGINAHAKAAVGETFVTASVGASETVDDEDGKKHKHVRDYQQNPAQNRIEQGGGSDFVENPWGYHWGAVVAVSGEDRVTLENYARNSEDKKANAAGITAETETRFYFNMYGAPNEKNAKGKVEDQSFHGMWKKLGFANPITMAMHSGDRGKHNAKLDDQDAARYFSDWTSIRDQHDKLANTASPDEEADALLMLLAVAQALLKPPGSSAEQKEQQKLLKAWERALKAARRRGHDANKGRIDHAATRIAEAQKAQKKIVKAKVPARKKGKHHDGQDDDDDAKESATPPDGAVAKLHLLVDVEAKSLGPMEVARGDVGHVWVSLQWNKTGEVPDDDYFEKIPNGAQHKQLLEDGTNKYADPMGFYPLKWTDDEGERRGGYRANPAASWVTGEVKNPDRGHEQQEKATQTYHLTDDEAKAVLTYAESKRGAQYSLYFYNCTTFAKEAVRAAGKTAPSMSKGNVCYPNAAYSGIKKNSKNEKGLTHLSGFKIQGSGDEGKGGEG